MIKLSLNRFARVATFERGISALKQSSKKPTEIEYGMTTDEIAEIVSEKVIAHVRKQFEGIKTDGGTKSK